MNRRFFLSALAGAVAGAAYDPEKALWVPGKKLISIPKPVPVTATLHGWHLGIIRLGDRITFGSDPRVWTVTELYEEGRTLATLVPSGFVEKARQYLKAKPIIDACATGLRDRHVRRQRTPSAIRLRCPKPARKLRAPGQQKLFET
jgi:hypothetical protein